MMRSSRAIFSLLWILSVTALLVLCGVWLSSASAEACPNAAFRTGPSAALPECRAYEQVSPAFKNGVG